MKNIIKILIGILLIFNYSYPVLADSVNYYNLTTSQYKFIQLEELSGISLIDNYKYEVLLNNNFLGYYTKDEHIFYPDNSNITIIIPSPIKTSTDNLWELSIKPQLFYMIGLLISWGWIIILVCYALYVIQRKIRKGY